MSTPQLAGLTPAWRRMLSSISFLRVQHPAKRAFDYGWPLVLTVVTVGMGAVRPVPPPILGDKGFLKGLQTLIGLLAAFFVAALAAVSTVERKALDAPMLGDPPVLDGKPLFRRRFVCLLFGYLSILAFGLFLLSVAADAIVPSLRVLLDLTAFKWVRGALGAIYAFGFWNMATTTLLGIWFLVERVPMSLPPMATPDNSPDNFALKPGWQPARAE